MRLIILLIMFDNVLTALFLYPLSLIVNCNEKMAKRAPNFTQNEKEWLLHYVDKNKNVLECKKSDVNTNGMKIKTWEKIEQEFNASSNGEYRSAQVLRKKWENVKKRAKEKAAEEKNEMITTGGGPAPSIKFNDEEKRVIEILGEERVSGSKFEFDCDNEDLCTEIIFETDDHDYIIDDTDTDTTGMLELLKYNKKPSSSLLTPPIKEIQKSEMDKSLNVAKQNASDFQSKWKNMSAESLRQPITECLSRLRQVDDGSISNTQEVESSFTRKRKHLQDKIDKWINNKSNVAEESVALQNVKANGEKILYELKEKKLKQELIFSAQKYALEIEILELQKQKFQKELGIPF